MRRAILLMSLVSLIGITAGCGSGSSTSSSGSSLVTITVGGNGKSAAVSIGKNTFLARSLFTARKFIASAGSAFAAIPNNVTEISFTITGPEAGFQTISRKVPVVSGNADLTEQFAVPNGNRRHFLVEAGNGNSVLYRGENDVDLTGIPVSVNIQMIAIFQPALGLSFSLTPVVVGADVPSVNVNISGTLTNNGNESLNNVACTDSFSTPLTVSPASITQGGTATIGGSYIPNPQTGPYSDTITCSGVGAGSGATANQTSTASNNFRPSISFMGGGTTYCSTGDGGIWISGSIFNAGDERVSNVTCSAPLLSTIYFDGQTTLTALSFLDILSAPVNIDSDYTPGTSPSVRVTCSGTGAFSGVAFSNATTLTCP
jgi:hypothetical protein